MVQGLVFRYQASDLRYEGLGPRSDLRYVNRCRWRLGVNLVVDTRMCVCDMWIRALLLSHTHMRV
jgi:hypothetical protein